MSRKKKSKYEKKNTDLLSNSKSFTTSTTNTLHLVKAKNRKNLTSNVNKINILELPKELQYHIFVRVKFHDLIKLPLTCKYFSFIYKDKYLWEQKSKYDLATSNDKLNQLIHILNNKKSDGSEDNPVLVYLYHMCHIGEIVFKESIKSCSIYDCLRLAAKSNHKYLLEYYLNNTFYKKEDCIIQILYGAAQGGNINLIKYYLNHVDIKRIVDIERKHNNSTKVLYETYSRAAINGKINIMNYFDNKNLINFVYNDFSSHYTHWDYALFKVLSDEKILTSDKFITNKKYVIDFLIKKGANLPTPCYSLSLYTIGLHCPLIILKYIYDHPSIPNINNQSTCDILSGCFNCIKVDQEKISYLIKIIGNNVNLDIVLHRCNIFSLKYLLDNTIFSIPHNLICNILIKYIKYGSLEYLNDPEKRNLTIIDYMLDKLTEHNNSDLLKLITAACSINQPETFKHLYHYFSRAGRIVNHSNLEIIYNKILKKYLHHISYKIKHFDKKLPDIYNENNMCSNYEDILFFIKEKIKSNNRDYPDHDDGYNGYNGYFDYIDDVMTLSIS